MDSDSFTPIDHQGNSFRAHAAAQLSGTILILISGVVFGVQWLAITPRMEALENMVSGSDAMPGLTAIVLKYRTAMAGLGAMTGLSALVYIWALGRDTARVIGVFTAAVTLLLLGALLIDFGMTQPLLMVVTKLSGR